jgi:hypothetical protein
VSDGVPTYYLDLRYTGKEHGVEFRRRIRVSDEEFYKVSKENYLTVLYDPLRPYLWVVYRNCSYRAVGPS